MAATSPPYDDLLDVLREIARGLKDPKSRAVAAEVPADVAANHLDYLAIQELMGRRGGPKDPDHSVVFAAKRSRGSTRTTITVFTSAPAGAKLAVFTARGAPTEVLEGGNHVKATSTAPACVEFELDVVTNDQPIIRLELQRADGYPIALGPRLAPV